MDTTVPTNNPWRWPTVALWALFFIAGLLPDETFEALRIVSGVVTARAAINSPWVLPLAQCAFLFHFVLGACQRARIHPHQASAKALQIAILALIAFLPVELSQLLNIQHSPIPELRMFYCAIAIIKASTWLYLFQLIARYHLQGPQVLRALWVIFPSARHPHP